MLRLLDLTLPTPEENLALDEALLLALNDEVARGTGALPPAETLRIWESPVRFVVLGVSGRLREEVDVDACARAGVPILRRASGGGTVVQGPGCLNFALVLSLDARPELRDVTRSYAKILGGLRDALDLEGAEPSGTSDLAIRGRKISGNAQKRTAHAILHHGTLLHGFDIACLEDLLLEPEKQPAYRGGRSHPAFVQNAPLSAREIRSRLLAAWPAAPAPGFQPPNLGALIAEKYGNREWVERF
jgi:lipoate-protein ligase A